MSLAGLDDAARGMGSGMERFPGDRLVRLEGSRGRYVSLEAHVPWVRTTPSDAFGASLIHFTTLFPSRVYEFILFFSKDG